jgi:uncharacterized protein DUF3108
MKRVFLTAMILAAACAPVQPPPPQPAPVVTTTAPPDPLRPSCEYRYWHIAPHARWEYRVTSKGSSYPHPTGTMDFTRREEVVNVTPGEFRIAFTSSDSQEPPWIKFFRCGESGPAQIPNDFERANGTRLTGVFVPTTMQPGTEWENVYASGGSTSSTKFRADGTERITTLAGTYDAVRVRYTRTDRSATSADPSLIVEGTLWFAPGVGVIKEEFTQTTNPSIRAEGQTLEELIAFSAGIR